MDALAASTSNASRFFGRQDIGHIAPGALADLVLLKRNPLDDIHNTTSISAVVADGHFYDRAALDEMLRGVERAAGNR
jgi:imidazolonepropionase-like amidohydrolase